MAPQKEQEYKYITGIFQHNGRVTDEWSATLKLAELKAIFQGKTVQTTVTPDNNKPEETLDFTAFFKAPREKVMITLNRILFIEDEEMAGLLRPFGNVTSIWDKTIRHRYRQHIATGRTTVVCFLKEGLKACDLPETIPMSDGQHHRLFYLGKELNCKKMWHKTQIRKWVSSTTYRRGRR